MIRYGLEGKKGALAPVTGDGAQGPRVLWMELNEFRALDGGYPHKKALVRSMEPVQYCKVEIFGDCLLGTVKAPGEGSRLSFAFGFYLAGERLILVGGGAQVRTMLEKLRCEDIEVRTLNHLLLLLMELMLADDVLFLQKLEEKLGQLEETLLKAVPGHFYETIIAYRKRLSALRAYYGQMINLGDMMQSAIAQALPQEERAGWQLFTGRAQRLSSHVDELREYLLQIRELYQSQVEAQQNQVMRYLAIVTTLFLPLTLIVGWYGMNFPNMPEFGWAYGYPVVIAVSALIVLAEIWFFRRKRLL